MNPDPVQRTNKLLDRYATRNSIDRYGQSNTRVAVEDETRAPVVGGAHEIVVAEEVGEAVAEAHRGHVERRRRHRRCGEQKDEEKSCNRAGGSRRHHPLYTPPSLLPPVLAS